MCVCVAEEAPQVRLKINQQQQLQKNEQFQCVGKGNDFGVAQTKVDVGRTLMKTVGEESLIGFFRSWGIIKRQVAMCVCVRVCDCGCCGPSNKFWAILWPSLILSTKKTNRMLPRPFNILIHVAAKLMFQRCA